ncbi:hypothetical protein OH77DRAFT_852685 [Trametes cingulata]|nr:hypothetical protein OH77DRAFT_852685 [Trametes cingulata]
MVSPCWSTVRTIRHHLSLSLACPLHFLESISRRCSCSQFCLLHSSLPIVARCLADERYVQNRSCSASSGTELAPSQGHLSDISRSLSTDAPGPPHVCLFVLLRSESGFYLRRTVWEPVGFPRVPSTTPHALTAVICSAFSQ